MRNSLLHLLPKQQQKIKNAILDPLILPHPFNCLQLITMRQVCCWKFPVVKECISSTISSFCFIKRFIRKKRTWNSLNIEWTHVVKCENIVLSTCQLSSFFFTIPFPISSNNTAVAILEIIFDLAHLFKHLNANNRSPEVVVTFFFNWI